MQWFQSVGFWGKEGGGFCRWLRIFVGGWLLVWGLLGGGGCLGRGAEAVSNIALEAALEQSLSTYHNVSASITTNKGSKSIQCAKSGSGTYTQEAESDKICWISKLQDCTFEGDKGRTLVLNGESKLCYASASKPGSSDLEGLASAGSLSFSGSLTLQATTAEGVPLPKTTCSYSLEGSLVSSTEGGQTCGSLKVSGSMNCGARDKLNPKDLAAKLCVSAEVKVSP